MALSKHNNSQPEIDKRWVARCFAHSRKTYEQEASVQRQVAEKMMQLMEATWTDSPSTYRPQHIVEVGCGTGIFSRLLQARLHPESLLLNDLCPEMEDCLEDLCRLPNIRFLAKDAETLAFPAQTELIASCSTVQWFHHPKEFINRCHEALTDQGWLAFSTFGPQNMYQIKELTGHGLSYSTLQEWTELLSERFDIAYREEEIAELRFQSPLEVLKHMKQTGVTGTEKRMWTRGILHSFCERYIQRFGQQDQTVTLTYHPIYLICKKKKV